MMKVFIIKEFIFNRQRIRDMEVWALKEFDVAHVLQEMLTNKSDHIRAIFLPLDLSRLG